MKDLHLYAFILRILLPYLCFLYKTCDEYKFNPYHAKFHKWKNPLLALIIYYHFYGYQDENLKLVSQQYRAWSYFKDVQAGLAQYWQQRLITFGVGRISI